MSETLVGKCEGVAMHSSRWRSLAEDGHVAAQVMLGLLLYAGDGVPQDFKEATRWFRAAALQEDARAQFNLAAMYENGLGVAENASLAV
jgi:TPR repeat protein